MDLFVKLLRLKSLFIFINIILYVLNTFCIYYFSTGGSENHNPARICRYHNLAYLNRRQPVIRFEAVGVAIVCDCDRFIRIMGSGKHLTSLPLPSLNQK